MPSVLPLSARVLQSPRVGFGLTTAALVALASGGTSVLVSHGTQQLQPVAPRVVAQQPPTAAAVPLVVPRAPGSLVAPPLVVERIVTKVVGPPVSRVPSVTGPATVAVPPVSVPPVTTPPVEAPPVTTPPVVTPPVVSPAVKPGKKAPRAHIAHPAGKGKHLGQHKH